jgi:hypothetical protein
MAAVKVLFTFENENKTQFLENIEVFIKDSVIISTVGQLAWSKKGKGYFAINAAESERFVGFLDANKMEFSDVTFQTESEFVVIQITRLEKNKELAIHKKYRLLLLLGQKIQMWFLMPIIQNYWKQHGSLFC